jgi:valyl-tRNA synthetase
VAPRLPRSFGRLPLIDLHTGRRRNAHAHGATPGPAAPGWSLRAGRCPDCGADTIAETDVLDTWFSSSLWFLAIAGWPGPLDPAVHPLSIITAGRDILYFWVLRSLAFSRRLGGGFPTATCYLHGLVLDAQGRKMSKSRATSPACVRRAPSTDRTW